MTHQTPSARELLARNAVWAKQITSSDPAYFARLAAEKQHPKVLWIGCADSRVSETTICACKLGDIFTHRNIVNMVAYPDNDCSLSVIQYAVDTLLVEDIVVVGHTACGGVEAAWLASKEPSGFPGPSHKSTTPLTRWLAPLIALSTELGLNNYPDGEKAKALRILTEENARRQVRHISTLPKVQAAVSRGQKLSLNAWVFQMETGTLVNVGGPVPKL
ncbi:carbonic anhydrase [Mycena galopus ATCC 62051]|nr:carbonic anhydrase [Mycena galopus ATCC 62051]